MTGLIPELYVKIEGRGDRARLFRVTIKIQFFKRFSCLYAMLQVAFPQWNSAYYYKDILATGEVISLVIDTLNTLIYS